MELKNYNLRNAYKVKLPREEYNPCTSARHLSEMKMYAELIRTKKNKKLGIKSLSDNTTALCPDVTKLQSLIFKLQRKGGMK